MHWTTSGVKVSRTGNQQSFCSHVETVLSCHALLQSGTWTLMHLVNACLPASY